MQRINNRDYFKRNTIKFMISSKSTKGSHAHVYLINAAIATCRYLPGFVYVCVFAKLYSAYLVYYRNGNCPKWCKLSQLHNVPLIRQLGQLRLQKRHSFLPRSPVSVSRQFLLALEMCLQQICHKNRIVYISNSGIFNGSAL